MAETLWSQVVLLQLTTGDIAVTKAMTELTAHRTSVEKRKVELRDGLGTKDKATHLADRWLCCKTIWLISLKPPD
ncbi:hypothetical protein RLEG12_08055 (plasmid) [Rhizobium leguminosarum bv. trifolii CB782]|nr:hypothetical protein RLEG12_08055 [Rhizobium leguminosarum bv. trifolii CB782]